MTSELSFDWDDENRKHLARHDVTRAEFEQVINDPILFDYQNIDGEDRWTVWAQQTGYEYWLWPSQFAKDAFAL